ncbi:MlaC/ttg2D family ABC transporter substrate-binding protein [Kiloniella sp.]|uniref:MlaC/ttg2D family ABC transporter substrate-binding protein n=1 Tax=Kiloniella sp. TaxID=1938587 RepID=UPI003B013F88
MKLLISRLISYTSALLVGAALSLAVSTTARADDAGLFLKALQEEAVSQLSNESISSEEREQQFRSLLNENFDISGIAKFVVGKYWRKAEDGPRSEFMTIFEDIMVQRFLPTFSKYASSDFKVTKVVKKKSFYVVYSKIKTEGGEPAQLLWRIQAKETSGFVITDIAAEGISLRSTYKSDYTSALKSLGGDLSALNGKLRKKIKSGDFAPKDNS